MPTSTKRKTAVSPRRSSLPPMTCRTPLMPTGSSRSAGRNSVRATTFVAEDHRKPDGGPAAAEDPGVPQPARTLEIVVTVDMLTTGVDIPALEFIVFLRPVKSSILWVQMLGRGTSKCDLHQ